MNWQRARKPSQKAERVAAILESAAGLFDQKELLDISMRDVAAESGLSKASLYSYFKTKEEVFARLFLLETQAWFEIVEAKLKRLRSASVGRASVGRVAKLLTDVLRERQRFCRLAVVLASLLEKNLSEGFIRDFKMELQSYLQEIVTELRRVVPGITVKSGMEFFYVHQSLIAGLWPVVHPAPEVAIILQERGVSGFQVEFFKLFQETIETVLAAQKK